MKILHMANCKFQIFLNKFVHLLYDGLDRVIKSNTADKI